MNINNKIIHESKSHESGERHVAGSANYTDDLLEPEGLLFGAIGYSKCAHAVIKKIDLRNG